MNYAKQIIAKIENKTALIGIVGMGYVGRPLADLTTNADFKTIGFVRNQDKAHGMNTSSTKHPNLRISADSSEINKCDIVLVCVQTPVHDDKTPDLSVLVNAVKQVADNGREGQLVVIESSIAPGTTREVLLPILEEKGYKLGKNLLLAFSPERVDPGNRHFTLDQIPKVVSGVNQETLEVVTEFYKQIINKVVPVSSLEAAELTKILENTYRLVNISLVNEVADYAETIGVNIWEVISAASTKPFGFMAHYPGPGIGGHCIPVDPYYLIDDAKKRGVRLRMVEHAGKVNDHQPKKVVKKTIEVINKTNGKKKMHKIMLIGITYKPDIDDTRESPALTIWKLFEQEGINVAYHDPYVGSLNGFVSHSLELDKQEFDAIIITTNHSNIDYERLRQLNIPIIDTRNVFGDVKSEIIFRL